MVWLGKKTEIDISPMTDDRIVNIVKDERWGYPAIVY